MNPIVQTLSNLDVNSRGGSGSEFNTIECYQSKCGAVHIPTKLLQLATSTTSTYHVPIIHQDQAEWRRRKYSLDVRNKHRLGKSSQRYHVCVSTLASLHRVITILKVCKLDYFFYHNSATSLLL